MDRLSSSQKSYLRRATGRYHQSLEESPAQEYLATRGLDYESIKPDIEKFVLGYVAEPMVGHEQFKGFLAIPYLRWSQEHGWAVVSIRFRCIEDHEHKGHGKYMSAAGDRPRLFNTLALIERSPSIAVTEGEFDAMTMQACGIPTVGVPGAKAWRPYFREPFLGYREVFVLADGDDAGKMFASTIGGSLPNARVVQFPYGHDANSYVIEHGKRSLLERLR